MSEENSTPKSNGVSRRAVLAGGTALTASLFMPKGLKASDFPHPR